MRRTIGFLFAAAFAASAAGARGQDAAALMERLTGPSSRLEPDLRVLTDEIGGRPTGSPPCARPGKR